MKIQSKNSTLDRSLQKSCGWLYGREVATLTREALRLAQSKVDAAFNAIDHERRSMCIERGYTELKTAVNRALQSRS